MKYEELQKQLDKRKYLEGIDKKRDPSGFMPYCEYCNHQKVVSDFTDPINPTTKVIGCGHKPELVTKYKLCAKAYNMMCKYHTAINKVYD